LEHGATFEKATIDKDEEDAHSHLQRVDAACSEVAADFVLVQDGRVELVDHSQKVTSMQEKYAPMVVE
jgi:hypothetical protein